MVGISELISRCVEQTIDDGPEFVIRSSIHTDVDGAIWLLRREHENRVQVAAKSICAHGRSLDNGDIFRAWSLLNRREQLIGLMCGIEGDQSVRISELYIASEYRCRGLGGQLLWCAQHLAGRRLNPVIATLSEGDVSGRAWLVRRGFEEARHCDGSPVRLDPGPDGLAQICLIHANGCGFPVVRIAR